jgi:hypothetical protein
VKHFLSLLILVLCLAPAATTKAQNFSLTSFSISGGGGASTGGVYIVRGTIGQPDTGRMTNGNFVLNAGFWSLAVAVQSPGSPVLLIQQNSGSVTVYWAADVTGFTLETTSSLTPTINWQPVTGVVGNSVTLPSTPGTSFYRLRSP